MERGISDRAAHEDDEGGEVSRRQDCGSRDVSLWWDACG